MELVKGILSGKQEDLTALHLPFPPGTIRLFSRSAFFFPYEALSGPRAVSSSKNLLFSLFWGGGILLFGAAEFPPVVVFFLFFSDGAQVSRILPPKEQFFCLVC